MAVYLVDFENVSSAGLSGIQKLTKEDKVYIFYTVNASNMSFAAHMNLLSSPAEVTYYNVASGGKNALDFQLSSFLGYLICQGKEKKFCIISNDRGFEYVKAFWEKNGVAADISISGSPSINRSLLPMEKPFSARIQQNIPEAADEKPVSVESAAEEQVHSAVPASVIEEKPEKSSDSTASEQTVTESAPKKRGRPKGKTSSESEKAAASKAKTAAKSGGEKASEPAAKTKTVSKTSAANAKKSEHASSEAVQTLKQALTKANVTDDDNVNSVMKLLKSTAGKQQFYHGILKIFGMERGVEVYKVIRPEYTNLTKLIK